MTVTLTKQKIATKSIHNPMQYAKNHELDMNLTKKRFLAALQWQRGSGQQTGTENDKWKQVKRSKDTKCTSRSFHYLKRKKFGKSLELKMKTV